MRPFAPFLVVLIQRFGGDNRAAIRSYSSAISRNYARIVGSSIVRASTRISLALVRNRSDSDSESIPRRH